MMLTFQILAVIIFVGLGAFFSGSETGVYRISRFRLRLMVQNNRRFAKLLDSSLADSQGLVFSILIGNNLVNYLSTSIITIVLLKTVDSENASLFTTLIMTPLLFVCSEVIPKNLYYYNADNLMVRFAPLLWLVDRVLVKTGIVGVMKLIAAGFGRLFRIPATSAIAGANRNNIRQLISETHDEGIVSSVQSDILNRLINAPKLSLGTVLVPAAKVDMLELNSDREDVLAQLERSAHTRVPVYRNRRNSIVGYINIYKVLACKEEFTNLKRFLQPMARLQASMPVIEAMNVMRKNNHKIVLVAPMARTSKKNRPKSLGVVTMKDIVEELTGELAQW
jgi:putative hemolysin